MWVDEMERFHSPADKVLVVQSKNSQNHRWRATGFTREIGNLFNFPKFQEKAKFFIGEGELSCMFYVCSAYNLLF